MDRGKNPTVSKVAHLLKMQPDFVVQQNGAEAPCALPASKFSTQEQVGLGFFFNSYNARDSFYRITL